MCPDWTPEPVLTGKNSRRIDFNFMKPFQKFEDEELKPSAGKRRLCLHGRLLDLRCTEPLTSTPRSGAESRSVRERAEREGW